MYIKMRSAGKGGMDSSGIVTCVASGFLLLTENSAILAPVTHNTMTMKKMFPLAIVALAFTLLPSCVKRDYVCSCTENHGGGFSVHNYKLGNVNGNTAENKCSDKQLELSGSGIASKCHTTF